MGCQKSVQEFAFSAQSTTGALKTSYVTVGATSLTEPCESVFRPCAGELSTIPGIFSLTRMQLGANIVRYY